MSQGHYQVSKAISKDLKLKLLKTKKKNLPDQLFLSYETKGFKYTLDEPAEVAFEFQ